MCAANPAMEGESVRALEEKLDAGARVVVTQPWAVAPAAARRWWGE
jgi:5,10-methylenetetrahydrofolate reductase